MEIFILNKVGSEIGTTINDIELFKMAPSIFLTVTWQCVLLAFGDRKNSAADIQLFFLNGVMKLNIYFCGCNGYSPVNSTVTL